MCKHEIYRQEEMESSAMAIPLGKFKVTRISGTNKQAEPVAVTDLYGEDRRGTLVTVFTVWPLDKRFLNMLRLSYNIMYFMHGQTAGSVLPVHHQ